MAKDEKYDTSGFYPDEDGRKKGNRILTLCPMKISRRRASNYAGETTSGKRRIDLGDTLPTFKKKKEARMLKPPIARMGGKSKLRKTIIEMLPEHTCYVELFMGAGWVYFGKKPSKVEVVNDIDSELVNLFKMLKYHAPEVERLLQYEFSGRDIFEEYKYATLEQLTEIHRAIRFLYVISQSFASKGDTYGYAPTAKPSGNIYYTDLLYQVRDRLRNT